MGSNQQFSLRWNNYLQHITHVFDTLRDDENLVDVTLCCEGKKIRAHKMLLSACSSYFREIFKENPCQHPVIIFRNVKYEDLEALVSFMYKGEVNVEQDGLSSFLSTAELLEVKGLTGSGPCFPETIVEEESPPTTLNESKVSRKQPSPKGTKPDSPMTNKKRRTIEESPPRLTPTAITPSPQQPTTQTSSAPQLKCEPIDYLEQDCEEGPELPDSPEIKIENNDGGSWSEENVDGINDQVFAHGLWRRLHPSLKRFGCDECGKVFKHPRSLDHHKKMHEGRTTCPFCRRVFGRMYALRLHMSSSHPGQPMYQSTKSH